MDPLDNLIAMVLGSIAGIAALATLPWRDPHNGFLLAAIAFTAVMQAWLHWGAR